MTKIILTAIMAFTFLYAGLINFSYAEDLAKGVLEPTGVEKAYENLPISLEEKKIEQGADDSYEKDREDDVVEEEKVEVEKEDEPDEHEEDEVEDKDEVEDGDDEKVEVGVEERRKIRERP
jgi:hypothetical protein